MISKKLSALVFVFMLLVLSGIAIATPYDGTQEDVNLTNPSEPDYRNADELPGIDVMQVLVEGIERSQGSRLELERGQEVEVKVEIEASEDVPYVTIEARINGDDEVVSEETDTFDVKDGNAYIRTFDLELPDNMERMEYNLWINVWTPNNGSLTYNYPIDISTAKHKVLIRDVTFNPNDEVKAGRALLTVVRLKNIGKADEDSVKVKVAIPDLNLYVVDYIDELESEDSASSEEMYMRIPSTAKEGDYDVVVTAEYDDGDKETEEECSIRIVGDEESASQPDGGDSSASGTIQITAGPQTQDTARGQGGVIYPVSITNPTSEAKSFELSVSGVEAFGTVKVSPSTLLVVDSGATETFYIYVSANEDATYGSHTFGVAVKSNGEMVKEFPLSVNVIEGQEVKEAGWDSVKKGLLVGLVVLIVLLVILGLIIAFNKMKGSEDEEELDDGTASQTYY